MSGERIDVDVVIVGGGVAGSTLAIVLSRSGMRVVVAEREARFRDRVRGEALMPWGAALASELGIASALPESGARPLPIWQVYSEREARPPFDWRWDVPGGDVLWGVDHPGLQERLLGLAADAGATVLRPAKALAPRCASDGRWLVPMETRQGVVEAHARLIVGADGRASGVRRWIGAASMRDPVKHVIGGCLIAGGNLDPDAAHIAYFSGGAAYIFRQESGRSRLYVIRRPEDVKDARGGLGAAMLEIAAAALPDGSLTGAQAIGPAAYFPGADVFASRIAGDGIVLISDAAGANDPTQGQGLSLALQDVRELSRLLREEDSWQRAIETYGAMRPRWYEPLRAYAKWTGPLLTGVGAAADAARARVVRARELDPALGGYSAIHALGPDGLPVTEAARRHVLGEDLALPTSPSG